MGRCCKNCYSSSIDAFLKNIQWGAIYIHISIYVYVCINTYIHIHIYNIYIYIYIYIYIINENTFILNYNYILIFTNLLRFSKKYIFVNFIYSDTKIRASKINISIYIVVYINIYGTLYLIYI